ncbi:MAG: formylglycine-generating enzyme family protein [Chloroflexaceae bacterium]
MSFWIARYPVTVAQYRAFMKAGGYDEQNCWIEHGWVWKQRRKRTYPWGWDDPKYTSSNQAVIGVTWYEAMAFCAWLTAQLTNVLSDGYAICLPTEAEWEAAAAYDATMQRRIYPWGKDATTPEHAIFRNDQGSSLGAPAPVGICPGGAAACGALDVSGQVWEYCRSSYKAYPREAHAAQKDFTTSEIDVPLRGGSRYSDSTYVRCGARNGYHPVFGYVNHEGGFRVVAAPLFAE